MESSHGDAPDVAGDKAAGVAWHARDKIHERRSSILVASNKAASPLGLPPYPPNADLEGKATQICVTVAWLRKETPPDATVRSDSYLHACLMATAWLHGTIFSSVSTVLVPLLGCFFDELFHMLNIRHADEEAVRLNASNRLIELSSLQFGRDGARTYLQAVLEKVWTDPDGFMIRAVRLKTKPRSLSKRNDQP
ncbi:uncharacterized protein PV07_08727 [Cladophialophora immunda]|uniref:Uncharacterized protein n=1 Tax=Cladophialophora immunda TaxID=569365 RepID=A0A0D2C544_9EURO|nr:uncharacterized protein PV07_08727 [Cladophialophora immunda]KIW25560.1 hypothetical protein PV07_08727 [Cladophialophora immunda]OQV11237.1 hypothetical protein CLAIMM_15099 [Cladophialophora immunda]